MDYIDNLTLTILIALLRDGELILSAPDMDSLAELSVFISTLDGYFVNKPDNLTIEQEEVFNENYVPTIEYEERYNELNISCNNGENLERFLHEYAHNYENGTLIEGGNTNEFNTISALHDMLFTKAEGMTTNKAQYINTDIKYAPLVLLKYFENNDFIQRLTIQLVPKEEMPYPMILFERGLDGLPEEYTSNWHEYFNCRYVLNMDWYIEEYNKSISKTITKERRNEFAPLQEKVYRYIYNNAKEGVFMLSRADLKNCMTLTTKDKTLNDFRNQYREIFNKLPNFDIISYNRSTKLYDIHKDILTDKIE